LHLSIRRINLTDKTFKQRNATRGGDTLDKMRGNVNRRPVCRIVAIYVLFSSAWIYLSGTILGKIIHDPDLAARIEIYKGLLFVLITAAILYTLITRYVLCLDETDRQLKSSEERFRTIYDGMFEAVLILDAVTGEIVDANRAMCGMFGYTHTEAIQLEFREIGSGEPPCSDAEAMEILSRAAHGLPQLFDWRVRKKSGDLFWAAISMQKTAIEGEDRIIALVRDITERKQFEEELRLMDFSINNISDAVYWITMDGRFRNVNAAACKMLGYSREELLLLSVRDIDPDYQPAQMRSDIEKLKPAGSLRFERHHTTRDGRIIPVEITGNYFRYNDLEYICSTVRDITERAKAEKEASFFRTLIEYTRDPVYVLDPGDGFRMVYANQAACSHYGTDLEHLLTMRIPDWDPEFDMQNIGVMMNRLKQGESMRFETIHRIASGKLVPVEITANYLLHDGEELTYGYFYDISERKAMESALKDSETRYRTLTQEFQALLNGIPDGLTLLSPDLTVLWANTVSARTSRLEPSEMIGKRCYEVRHELDVPCRRCPVQNSLATGEPEKLVVHPPNGRTIELRTIPVKDENGRVVKVIEIGRDVTEHQNLEQQLHHSQKMEAVGQLAGGIAHDFNNILTAIIGFASLVLMKMEENDPLRHYVEQILSSSDKAAVLSQSLLAFSRKRIMSLQPVDLNEVIKNGQKLLLRLIREDIELKMELCPEALTVMADGIQLEQVFMNLVSNARDAMPNGGSLFIRTEPVPMDDKFTHAHGYGKPGDYACISLSDTGVGMDEKTREKIFEPFFTTKELGKGTGLGLAMVYGIIKQHDGYLNVYSEPGRGTTFKLYLPRVSQAVREEEKPESSFPAGGTETALLAEDDECVRKANKEILEKFGYIVIEATDGEDAIEKFARLKDRIDILILDVIMPKKSGKEVYDMAKEIRGDIKVLFTSGYTADFVTRKMMLDEKSHFIEKPVPPRELLAKVRETLNN
jgi:two-component system cell cycle sensor histidine kinase/response regulator CckA